MGAELTEFGPFTLDRSSGRLLSGGKPVSLGQRALALLEALAVTEGAVGKAALMEAAWPGTNVEDGNLTVQIAALRKALGKRPDGQEWIVTVPRLGYRLLRGEMSFAEVASSKPKLAVMPFDNLSGDDRQAYFADGVVEDLITALSQFHSFAVVSRNASFKYRGQPVDMREVARELGVRYLVEGSIRRGGARLRITAHLADGETGEHLWGRTFDGVVADIFDVQDHIAEHVVGVIEPEIRRAETARSRRKPPQTLDAYDLVLQARELLHTTKLEDNTRAFELCQQAIARDPNYAQALILAAWVIGSRRVLNWPALTHDDVEAALSFSERALAHCDGDPEVLIQRADILIQHAGEFEEGMQLLQRALAGNPNNVQVLQQASIDNTLAGSLEDALDQAGRTIELAPGDPGLQMLAHSVRSHVYIVQGKYAAAIEEAERAFAIDRSFWFASWMLVAANAHLGEMERAKHWLAVLLALRPGITVSEIASRQRPRWPERLEPILDGLRLAGLPER
jgi:TolB-like protein